MRFLIQNVLDEFAQRTPEATVFRCNDISLSYGDCVERTNQLANALLEQGVRRGDRVGIYLHKSLESAIAVFGILKAGAAYVPIDPRLPQNSVHYLLAHCGITHVVSESSKLDSLVRLAETTQFECAIGPASADEELPIRTMGWRDVAAMPTTPARVQPALIETDLAYIMYTSGSTGRPKGIMHTHRSGLSYAEAASGVYDVRPGDVLSNHSHLHFDMSTFDLFSGPLRGATTVIIPEMHMIMPASLSQLIEDERMTIWYSVSSALVELLLRGDLEQRNLESLRWVIFGGEPFPSNHLHNLMTRLPNARFSNVYGPAETNVCTYFNVPPLPNRYADTPIPIGPAWDIAEPLVIAEDGEPVQAGEQGELLIASSTQMQGYWNDPERTAAAFHRLKPYPDPTYEKVYLRTGDLVRAQEDGDFLFLGRKDRQVKVRGFRIELDGVEAALTSHELVAEAAVWVTDKQPATLEAAVILREASEAGSAGTDIKRHAQENLPHYAVPESIAIMDRFPRTGTGKIDRREIQAVLKELHSASSGRNQVAV
jgi:amino acid adenylation domain-containing protein